MRSNAPCTGYRVYPTGDIEAVLGRREGERFVTAGTSTRLTLGSDLFLEYEDAVRAALMCAEDYIKQRQQYVRELKSFLTRNGENSKLKLHQQVILKESIDPLPFMSHFDTAEVLGVMDWPTGGSFKREYLVAVESREPDWVDAIEFEQCVEPRDAASERRIRAALQLQLKAPKEGDSESSPVS